MKKSINLTRYQLTDLQCRDILFFLNGFCRNDQIFTKGLEHGLRMVQAKDKETSC